MSCEKFGGLTQKISSEIRRSPIVSRRGVLQIHFSSELTSEFLQNFLRGSTVTVNFVGYPMGGYHGIGFYSWDSTMLLQVNGKISVMYMMWDARMVLVLELGTTFYLEICRTGHNRQPTTLNIV